MLDREVARREGVDQRQPDRVVGPARRRRSSTAADQAEVAGRVGAGQVDEIVGRAGGGVEGVHGRTAVGGSSRVARW